MSAVFKEYYQKIPALRRQRLIASYVTKHPKINHGKGCLRFFDTTPIDLKALKTVFAAALTNKDQPV